MTIYNLLAGAGGLIFVNATGGSLSTQPIDIISRALKDIGALASLDSLGNFTANNNVTAFGQP